VVRDEARAVVPVEELEAGTAFHAAQHADQSLGQTPLKGNLVGQVVLALSALEKAIGGVCGHSQILGVSHDTLGLPLSKLEEVLAFDLQDVIDEAFEAAGVAKGKIALEQDPVEAGESGYNQGEELGDESDQGLHDVLLQNRVFGHRDSGRRTS